MAITDWANDVEPTPDSPSAGVVDRTSRWQYKNGLGHFAFAHCPLGHGAETAGSAGSLT